MAGYKVLKGVAHNVGHSFTSLMNHAGDDYVMGHILRFARRTKLDTLTINFVTGEASPSELLANPISEVSVWYTRMFWELVERQGSERSYVRAATLTLRYELAVQRAVYGYPEIMESPYTCDVRITDIRGKDYLAHFKGWWYPERPEPSRAESRPFWKFWRWFSA